MPRISTDNYDTVASWNGSQDLFIVEQPDGTKVATPAQVKQFVEAGDFEATGEVKDGHGNILKDMAKTVDVDAEIGDLSQTGLTGDSVAEQLGTVNEMISYSKQTLTVANYPLLYSDLVIIRFGKVVSVLFRGFKNLTANTENIIISALPAEFRPSEQVYHTLFQGGVSTSMARVIVKPNGELRIYPYGNEAASGAANMQGAFTYVI